MLILNDFVVYCSRIALVYSFSQVCLSKLSLCSRHCIRHLHETCPYEVSISYLDPISFTIWSCNTPFNLLKMFLFVISFGPRDNSIEHSGLPKFANFLFSIVLAIMSLSFDEDSTYLLNILSMFQIQLADFCSTARSNFL